MQKRFIDQKVPAFVKSEKFLSDTKLGQEIKTIIEISGPLTMSKYMKLCLTHPIYGFYNKKEVIGREGHFITSPEITSIFGELIGIWLYTQWEALNKPERINLIEYGPGKGKLEF